MVTYKRKRHTTFRTYRGAPIELKPGVTPDDVTNPHELGEALKEALREEVQNKLAYTKYWNNPILSYGAPGEWDQNGVYAPWIVYNPEDGKYYMFYNDQNSPAYGLGTSPAGGHYIGVAIGDFPLEPFTKYAGNPILAPSGVAGRFDEAAVLHPNVVWNSKIKRWVMYFTGRSPDGTSRIGRAVSDDLLNWTKDPIDSAVLDVGATGSWDDAHVRVPCAVTFTDATSLVTGKRWFLFYGGVASDGRHGVGLAEALDIEGKTFTKYAGNPLISLGYDQEPDHYLIGHIQVFRERGWWFMLYGGYDHFTGHIMAAASKDAYNWFKRGVVLHGSRTAIPGGPDGRAVQEGLFLLLGQEINYLYFGWENEYEHVQGKPTREIAVSFLPKDFLDRLIDSIAVYGWKSESIGANDSVTFPVNLLGYARKTLTFISDTGGTLTIETDESGDGDFQTYDTVTITANTKEVYSFPAESCFAYLKVSFDQAATVTAKLTAKRDAN